jgi:hypothetical protein
VVELELQVERHVDACQVAERLREVAQLLAGQSVITNVWVAIHRNVPSTHSGFRLPLLWMALPQHTPRQRDGSSSVDAFPLGGISPWGMPAHTSCAYDREALWTECGHPEMRRLPDGVFHCPG